MAFGCFGCFDWYDDYCVYLCPYGSCCEEFTFELEEDYY